MNRKLSEVIIPGDKIDVRLTREQREEENGGQMANVFQSSVCDYVSERELEISMPTQGGRMVLLPEGVRCEFVFYTHSGLYCCSGIVKSRCRKETLALLVVELASELKKFQRREYFRVDYAADMQYYEIDGKAAMLPKTELLLSEVRNMNDAGTAKRGFFKDISGGGAKFVSFAPHKRGDYILLMFRLSNGRFDESFYLVCQIVACEKQPAQAETYVNRAKFIFKNLKDREKIVRFVFEEERRMRRKEIR